MDLNEIIGKAGELLKDEKVKETVKNVLDSTDLDEKLMEKLNGLTGGKADDAKKQETEKQEK